MNISKLKIGEHFRYGEMNYIYAGSNNGVFFAYHAITIKVEFYRDIVVEIIQSK
jgi:hypothetical protein